MAPQPKNLLPKGWTALTLAEQLGNIGSEVHRAQIWQARNAKHYRAAIDRALELLDFTIRDSRWKRRLKEITRSRELLVDATNERKEYNSMLKDLDRYFYHFALAARLKK